MKRILLGITVALVVLGATLLGPQPSLAVTQVDAERFFVDPATLPFTALAGTSTTRYWGISNDGAGWRIEVPDNWNGDLVLGIRWNGGLESSLGTPNARGIPTWFIVPPELEEVIRERIETLVHAQPGGLLEGYSQMLQDESREREAEEWSEGLIGDASAQG